MTEDDQEATDTKFKHLSMQERMALFEKNDEVLAVIATIPTLPPGGSIKVSVNSYNGGPAKLAITRMRVVKDETRHAKLGRLSMTEAEGLRQALNTAHKEGWLK